MNPWKLTYDKFIPEQEKLRETLCTLGNGYLGTRGAAPETSATTIHYPGTYIAGVYNELITKIADRDVANEDFVNCSNWLWLNYRIANGPWFDRQKVKILLWRKELNMRRGVLIRRLRWQDDQGRITFVENERIVSMADPHYAAMRCTIVAENYSAPITIRAGLDGMIINAGVDRYKQLNSKHLEPVSLGKVRNDGIYLQMQTNQSKLQITEAQKTIVYQQGQKIHPSMRILEHGKERIIQEFTLDVKEGNKYAIEKIVSIYTSRDQGIPDNCLAAQEAIVKVEEFEQLYKSHQARWRALWKRFDIEIEGNDFMQMALRLHIFHLLQVASTYNEEIDAGLPARGLHGEAYRGIFWDEMFTFPLYNLHAPEITRSLLMYRYRRLKAAKQYAQEHGYRGAMFPWQSASKGDETTQIIHLNPLSGKWGPDFSSTQRHISIAVAYNVWTYYYVTGDRDFLDRYGAEMLFEIAHFWSSLATLNPKTHRFDIEGVMGPDEFHEKYPGAEKGGLKNNAYTNVLVVWVLQKALAVLDLLAEEERSALLLKVNIDEQEIGRWREMIKKITVVMDKNGIIHQFEGYMNLKELDWKEYKNKYEDIHRIDRILKAEGLSPDDFKASKQADVLMIFYLLNDMEVKDIFEGLGYNYAKDIKKKNYDYYLPRTSHGSTLSRVVHGYLAEKLGYHHQAMTFFMEALRSDMEDIQGGTTLEGIHCGVMGATVDIFLKCFMGLSFQNEQLTLDPRLPESIRSAQFQVRFRNIWFHIQIKPKALTICVEPLKEVSLQSTQEIQVHIRGKAYKLIPGKCTVVSFQRPSGVTTKIKEFIRNNKPKTKIRKK
ncbi:MAG: glycosyl hydrolase family 65 protein [Candidatus Omnitrophota bacterium]